MVVSKTIKGHQINIKGTWYEVKKDGIYVFKGNLEEGMSPEQIYQMVTAKLEFRLNGRIIYRYTLFGRAEEEKQSALELLAQVHECDMEEIEVFTVIDTDI